MALPDVDRSTIERALLAFDRDLRDSANFLRWEEDLAQLYAVEFMGRRYPPTTIVSLATGVAVPGGKRPNLYLQERGFKIARIPHPKKRTRLAPVFIVGKVYDRWPDINELFGGSRQNGISPSRQTSAIFLFTGDSGEQYGYRDEFDEAGVFSYTGEGQVGDMVLRRGNLAIVTHAADGRALHVFKSLNNGGGQKYLGEFAYASHAFRRGPDKNGDDRRVIVFHLVPVALVPDEEAATADAPNDELSPTSDLEEARRRALAAFAQIEGGGGKDARRTLYRRSRCVKEYVLLRANGLCESCRESAPFVRLDGTPYLEPHHTTRVSDGGLDHPRFVGAVCPTCHREIHHGRDGDRRNAELVDYLLTIEAGE